MEQKVEEKKLKESNSNNDDEKGVVLCELPNETVVEPVGGTGSERFDVKTRWTVLVIVATASLLPPFSGTLYVPTLPQITRDLNTDMTTTALTMSIYQLTSALSQLYFGPLSDLYVWDVYSLIGWRILQSLGAGALMVSGAGAIADCFPHAELGKAMGFFAMGPSLGTIIGPPIGGLMGAAFGWRSNFTLLASVSGLMFIVIIVFLPETRFKSKDTNVKKLFSAPVKSLSMFKYLPITLVALFAGMIHGSLLMVVTAFPELLFRIYGVPEALLGVYFLPHAVTSVIVMPFCGKAADKYGRRAIIFVGGIASPVLIFGLAWCFEFSWDISVYFIDIALMAVFAALARVGSDTFAIDSRPGQAGTVTAAIRFSQQVFAAIAVQVGVVLVESIGVGWGLSSGGFLLLLFFIFLMIYFVKHPTEGRKPKVSPHTDEEMVEIGPDVGQKESKSVDS